MLPGRLPLHGQGQPVAATFLLRLLLSATPGGTAHARKVIGGID